MTPGLWLSPHCTEQETDPGRAGRRSGPQGKSWALSSIPLIFLHEGPTHCSQHPPPAPEQMAAFFLNQANGPLKPQNPDQTGAAPPPRMPPPPEHESGHVGAGARLG